MRDQLSPMMPAAGASELAKAEALHALGAFYVRQGFPKQGLSLLLAAHKFAVPSMELNRAIAHAYILAGVPHKALAMLDALKPALESPSLQRAADRLRARALLALGRVAEAKAAFGESMKHAEPAMKSFRLAESRG